MNKHRSSRWPRWGSRRRIRHHTRVRTIRRYRYVSELRIVCEDRGPKAKGKRWHAYVKVGGWTAGLAKDGYGATRKAAVRALGAKVRKHVEILGMRSGNAPPKHSRLVRRSDRAPPR